MNTPAPTSTAQPVPENATQPAPTTTTQSTPVNPVAQPSTPPAPKKNKMWIWMVILLIIVGLAGIGAYYFLNQPHKAQYTASKNTTVPTATPTLTQPTPTLNPNTGNLYTDIKERLNQVIK